MPASCLLHALDTQAHMLPFRVQHSSLMKRERGELKVGGWVGGVQGHPEKHPRVLEEATRATPPSNTHLFAVVVVVVRRTAHGTRHNRRGGRCPVLLRQVHPQQQTPFDNTTRYNQSQPNKSGKQQPRHICAEHTQQEDSKSGKAALGWGESQTTTTPHQ